MKLIKKYAGILLAKSRRWRMVLILHFFPRQVYRFGARGVLPDKDHWIAKLDSPLDDFEFFMDQSTLMPEYDSVNVVIRGVSFDHGLLSEMKDPTYLVNWPYKLAGDNFLYATGDHSHLRRFRDNGMLPIFAPQEVVFDRQGNMHNQEFPEDLQALFGQPSGSATANQRMLFHHRGNTPDCRLGSALACIIALAKVSQRLEIYGWDQLMTSPLAHRSYWGALFSLASADIDSYRPYIVETAIFNWHYAHRLAQLPSINIHGYLSQVGEHPRLLNKIAKVIYQS